MFRVEEPQAAEFCKEISPFFLSFKNPESEATYVHYRLHERKMPGWFKWIMWIYIVLLVMRRIELLLFVYIHVPSVATTPTLEIFTVSVIAVALIIEGAFAWFERLTPLKGFLLLVVSFFDIADSSHEYYPNQPALVPMFAFRVTHRIEPCRFSSPARLYATGTCARG